MIGVILSLTSQVSEGRHCVDKSLTSKHGTVRLEEISDIHEADFTGRFLSQTLE